MFLAKSNFLLVLNPLNNNATNNLWLATLLEDIENLKLLFQMCFFYLVGEDKKNIFSNRISNYALGICQDEEVINPQCH